MEYISKEVVIETLKACKKGDTIAMEIDFMGREQTHIGVVKSVDDNAVVIVMIDCLMPVSFEYHNIQDNRYKKLTITTSNRSS
jgi:hypothetical protein